MCFCQCVSALRHEVNVTVSDLRGSMSRNVVIVWRTGQVVVTFLQIHRFLCQKLPKTRPTTSSLLCEMFVLLRSEGEFKKETYLVCSMF